MLRTEINPHRSVRLPLETELLLCCAAPHLSEAQIDHFHTLLREDLDWDQIVQRAVQHGVLPLLFSHLEATGTEAVPQDIVDLLRSYFYANKLHNRRLTQALLDLLLRLEGHGITPVPFKGPTLAVAAHGNLDLRQFGDLDLLVPERECGVAMQVLLSQGFRLKSEALNVQEEGARLSRCAYSFIHDADDISVDLHWGITAAMEYPYRAFALPLAAIDVWDHLESIPLNAIPVRSFALEDLFLILCIHGSKHRWERLGWLCDIAALIQTHPDMSWARIRANATRLGCRRMLDLGVFLAHALLGAALPDSLWQQVQQDSVVRSLARDVERELVAGVTGEPGIVARSRFYLRMRERWRDKAQYGVLLANMAIRSRISSQLLKR